MSGRPAHGRRLSTRKRAASAPRAGSELHILRYNLHGTRFSRYPNEDVTDRRNWNKGMFEGGLSAEIRRTRGKAPKILDHVDIEAKWKRKGALSNPLWRGGRRGSNLHSTARTESSNQDVLRSWRLSRGVTQPGARGERGVAVGARAARSHPTFRCCALWHLVVHERASLCTI